MPLTRPIKPHKHGRSSTTAVEPSRRTSRRATTFTLSRLNHVAGAGQSCSIYGMGRSALKHALIPTFRLQMRTAVTSTRILRGHRRHRSRLYGKFYGQHLTVSSTSENDQPPDERSATRGHLSQKHSRSSCCMRSHCYGLRAQHYVVLRTRRFFVKVVVRGACFSRHGGWSFLDKPMTHDTCRVR